MKTKAAVLSKIKRPLEIMELDIPQLQEGQALVRITHSALCHSQLNEIDGLKGEDKYLPHTLGHEAVGIVEKVGKKVQKVKENDKVILTWIKGQGMDVASAKYGFVNSGAISTFMQHAVISENRLVKLTEDIAPEQAALLGCTIPTAAGIIKNNLKAQGGSLAIFGAGGLGLTALLYAANLDFSKIIMVDINEDKLKLAKELGATHTINASKLNPADEIAKLGGVNFAVESSGAKSAMEHAFESIMDGGLVVIAGNLRQGDKILIDPFDLIKQKRIIGSWGGDTNPDTDIPYYASMIKSKKLDAGKLVSMVYSLEEINKAIEDFKNGKVVRAIIRMQDD